MPELSLFTVILGLVVVWLIFLSALFLRIYLHYNLLLREVKKGSLEDILREILKKMEETEEQSLLNRKKIDELLAESRFYVQKIGFVRFNPFKDTGGEQSFVLAFLDAEDNGIVLDSFFTRAGTRWYVKRVVKGKGVDVDLSKEEKQAVREAKRIKDFSL